MTLQHIRWIWALLLCALFNLGAAGGASAEEAAPAPTIVSQNYDPLFQAVAHTLSDSGFIIANEEMEMFLEALLVIPTVVYADVAEFRNENTVVAAARFRPGYRYALHDAVADEYALVRAAFPLTYKEETLGELRLALLDSVECVSQESTPRLVPPLALPELPEGYEALLRSTLKLFAGLQHRDLA